MKKQIGLIVSSILFSGQLYSQEAPTEQGFDDIEDIPGWIFDNRSEPLGETGWFQGVETIVSSNEGDTTSYIAANYRNTDIDNDGVPNTICNYLIMPDLGNLESISFYTRSVKASNNYNVYPDRLYVIYSPTGGVETGNCTDDLGDFSHVLMSINPDLTTELKYPEGYPLFEWTQFEVEVNGAGRVAFLYYVEDAGFYGTNSNFIGIDTVEWVRGEDEPTPNFEKINKPSEERRVPLQENIWVEKLH